MRVSASFQIVHRPVGRLGLGPWPHVVGRLGSGVWVSASFQIFALTAGGDVPGGEGHRPAGECPGECVSREKCPTLVAGHCWRLCTPPSSPGIVPSVSDQYVARWRISYVAALRARWNSLPASVRAVRYHLLICTASSQWPPLKQASHWHDKWFTSYGTQSGVAYQSEMTHCLDLSLSLRRTFSTRPLTNTHDWPAASASEATALRRYTNQIIIIINTKNLRRFITVKAHCSWHI